MNALRNMCNNTFIIFHIYTYIRVYRLFLQQRQNLTIYVLYLSKNTSPQMATIGG